MATLLASVAVLLPSPPPAAAQELAAEKVMIVGDSISHGSSGDWTWRYRLWKHLESAGTAVDFVGPRNDLNNIMTELEGDGDDTYADPAFDRDHSAKWGQPLTVEMNEINGKVNQYSPGLLLVLLGINDLGIWGHDPAKMEADLRTFITNARTAKADIRMVFGKVLPTKRAVEEPDFAARVSDYNNRLVQVAAELTTPASPIIVADTASGFVADDHTWDGVHPNGRGELRIAAAFADTLSSAFGMGSAYPRPLPEVPLGPQQAPVVSVTSTGPTTADLAWTPSVGATQYWVWTKDDSLNPEWTQLPIPLTSTNNPWHMEHIAAGGTYQYKVQAAKGDDAGAFSAIVTLTTTGETPAAPSGLTATPANGGADLRWTAAEHATGYRVFVRNVTANEEFSPLPIVLEGTQWHAGLLQNGATYEFKLQSVNGRIDGGTSSPVSVTPTGPVPAAPTNLRVINGNGEATLQWVSDANATGHEVYMRNVTAGESDFTKLPIPVSGEEWVAGMLVNGSTYEFKLRAVNGLILGGFSGAVTARPTVAPPAGPTGLTATAGNGEATLRWTAAANATGYYIHMRNVTAGETAFTKLPYPISGTSWVAEQLVNGATYEFRLQSLSGLIEGGLSSTVSVRPTVAAPAAPGNLSATAGDHEATLSWTAVANATGYYVHMRNITAGESTFTKLPFPVEGTEWTADLLVNGATYEFKLQSVSGLIDGAFSSTIRVTPTGPAPVAPTNLRAQSGNHKAVLTWTMPDHATSVFVYMRNVSAGETSFTKLPYPVSDDSWTAGSLVNGATYEFKVQAYNDLIAGGTSAAVRVVPSGPPPPGAESLTAVAGDRKVTLRWTGASGATGYDIWIREVTNGVAWKALPYTVSDDTFTAKQLINGAVYEFKVQSKDGLTPGGFSNTVSVTPWGPTPKVSSLRVTPKLGAASLTWSGSSTATGYYIQQRDVTNGQSFTELPYAVSGTSFQSKFLTPGHVYEFRVQAVSGFQRGVTSNVARITLPLPPPATGVVVKPAPYGLNISWNPVSGIESYVLYIKRLSTCDGDRLEPSKSVMTRLPFPVKGSSYRLDYLFDVGCYFVLVVPELYGAEANFSLQSLGNSPTYKDNEDKAQYELVLTYIYDEMYKNARSSAAADIRDYMRKSNVLAAYAMWAYLVKPGGYWDHKWQIADNIGPGSYPFERPNTRYYYHTTGETYEVFYDIWSNIHYGYVGMFCEIGAAPLQNWASKVGIDDPGDHRSIQIGIELWKSYGLNLGRRDVHDFVAANLSYYYYENKAEIFDRYTLNILP